MECYKDLVTVVGEAHDQVGIIAKLLFEYIVQSKNPDTPIGPETDPNQVMLDFPDILEDLPDDKQGH